MMPAALALCAPLLGPLPAAPLVALADEDPAVYRADVEFALDELEKRCGHFFRLKDIDWKKVRKELAKEVKSVETDGEHLLLLIRLLARLEDGHASVRPLAKGEGVKPPEGTFFEKRGPGFFLSRAGKKLYVKNAWGSAAAVGIEPGMEVVTIDGEKAARWLEARIEHIRDLASFSTDQQAFFHATHWGLADREGTRWKLELKTRAGKKKTRTATCDSKSTVPDGPAFPVPGLTVAGEGVRYARLESGFGYVHLRRVPEEVLAELDQALAALADAPGIVLDFRANGGGGCDHDALEARFVPAGHRLARMARPPLESAGPHPYGGRLVVIVDGNTRSAGETTSGMFIEDGRAWSIGESATAGMSSQKETIELPSKLFALYVSVRSNRSSFNQGRGVEGIGVEPQERVEYDPDDLAAGVDTILARAEALLRDFPQKRVRYDPADYGWGK